MTDPGSPPESKAAGNAVAGLADLAAGTYDDPPAAVLYSVPVFNGAGLLLCAAIEAVLGPKVLWW